MTLLFFANGETFAAGALPFKYVPATETETTNRLLMPVEVQDIRTWTVVDTGAPYLICVPKVAADAGIDPASALKKDRMLIRQMRLDGFVYRLNLGSTSPLKRTKDLPLFVSCQLLVEKKFFAKLTCSPNLRLKAEVGEDLNVDATVFVPEVEEFWGDFPSFIGLAGFLERI